MDFERSADERLTFAPAGTWLVRVHAQDPSRPLPAYRLASRFVEAAPSEVTWKSEEDGELEIEGDGLIAGCGGFGTMAFLLKSEEDGELEIEGDGLVAGCGGFATMAFLRKSEEDGELEIEGDGLVAGCVDRAAEIRRALCAAEDDHGDTLNCATPMRCRIHGELANGWGDDVDAFRFRVDGWRTVAIAARGATRGELFDAAGQRLDVARGDAGFRLVRTLSPGTYFVRVAGESEGFYGLEVRPLGR